MNSFYAISGTADFCLGYVNNAVVSERGTDFIRRHDLKQKIRRELSFGLLPKTLKGLRIYKIIYVNGFKLFSQKAKLVHTTRNMAGI